MRPVVFGRAQDGPEIAYWAVYFRTDRRIRLETSRQRNRYHVTVNGVASDVLNRVAPARRGPYCYTGEVDSGPDSPLTRLTAGDPVIVGLVDLGPRAESTPTPVAKRRRTTVQDGNDPGAVRKGIDSLGCRKRSGPAPYP